MADNVQINEKTTSGAIIATDEVGGAQHQYMKAEFGGDGTATKVTATEGLPIQNDDTDLAVTLDGEAVVLGAGTAGIGKLTANSGIDIGDVDILSIAPGDNNIGNVDIVSGTVTTVSTVTNLAQMGGAALNMNEGVLGTGTQRVTIATDDEVNDLLTTIDADTSKIPALGTAIMTGAAPVTLATDDTLTAAANALLTTIDADTAAMVIDLAAIEVLVTAGNVDLAAMEVLLTAIDADTSKIPSLGNSNMAGSSPVTIASDDTLTAAANAILTTIDTDTGVIAGDTTSIDGKITACNTGAVVLDTGTASIGKLAANSGVDIGDVDVTSVIPGVSATNLGKARASALGATDTGVAPLAVRNDDLADLSGADGDYTPLQVDANGALYTNQGMAEAKQASGVAAGGTPGADDMIAAVGSRYLKITALSLFATSATINTAYVDNVDNDLLGNAANPIALSLDADGDTVAGFVLPYNPAGWFKTDAVNEAVTLNLSAAQDIIWCISYVEEVA